MTRRKSRQKKKSLYLLLGALLIVGGLGLLLASVLTPMELISYERDRFATPGEEICLDADLTLEEWMFGNLGDGEATISIYHTNRDIYNNIDTYTLDDVGETVPIWMWYTVPDATTIRDTWSYDDGTYCEATMGQPFYSTEIWVGVRLKEAGPIGGWLTYHRFAGSFGIKVVVPAVNIGGTPPNDTIYLNVHSFLGGVEAQADYVTIRVEMANGEVDETWKGAYSISDESFNHWTPILRASIYPEAANGYWLESMPLDITLTATLTEENGVIRNGVGQIIISEVGEYTVNIDLSTAPLPTTTTTTTTTTAVATTTVTDTAATTTVATTTTTMVPTTTVTSIATPTASATIPAITNPTATEPPEDEEDDMEDITPCTWETCWRRDNNIVTIGLSALLITCGAIVITAKGWKK